MATGVNRRLQYRGRIGRKLLKIRLIVARIGRCVLIATLQGVVVSLRRVGSEFLEGTPRTVWDAPYRGIKAGVGKPVEMD